MSQIRDTGWSPPVLLAPELDAAAANIRGQAFSGRFLKGYTIIGVAITFEDNTNDTCRARLWICSSSTTRAVDASSESSAGTVPTSGMNLFASQLGGEAIDYQTGDGPDPIYTPIGLEHAGGFHICADVDNMDTPNPHRVRFRVDMRELI